jgi:hypothetical protein
MFNPNPGVVMKKLGILFFSALFCQSSMAAEVFTMDLSQPLQSQVESSCPWISMNDVQQMSIANAEEIGWSGGDGSQLLDELFEETGAEVNHTTVEAKLPVGTKAIYFNTQYFNNNGKAEILVTELSFSYAAGDTITLSLNETESVLQQTQGNSGETLLVCFGEGEEYASVSTKVTQRNVDGSRPTLGITALSDWTLEPL